MFINNKDFGDIFFIIIQYIFSNMFNSNVIQQNRDEEFKITSKYWTALKFCW